MDTKDKSLTDFITKKSDDEVINLALNHEEYIHRFQAMKTLINRDLLSEEIIFKYLEKDKETGHRIVECISNDDILTALSNNIKSYKASSIADLRIKDLSHFEAIKECRGNITETSNLVRLLSLPYSCYELVMMDIPFKTKELLLKHMSFVPRAIFHYKDYFSYEHVHDLFAKIGCSSLSWEIRLRALINTKVENIGLFYHIYQHDKSRNLRKALESHIDSSFDHLVNKFNPLK